MKLRRFVGADTREAMQKIKATFGADAVILSSQSVKEGIEMVAAIDFDETMISQKAAVAELTRSSEEEVIVSPMDDMKQEISTLREMLEAQLKGALSHSEPLHMVLMQKLTALGVSFQTANGLLSHINPHMSQKKAFDAILRQLIDTLPIYQNNRIEEGGIYAFIGSTGVGKTTTLAKIAARFALRYGEDALGLISMDNYRIAAEEQLMVYGKILGVTVSKADDELSLSRAIRQLSDKKLILIDTAGMGPQDDRIDEQMRILKAQKIIQTVLVLPATSHYQVLMAIVNRYGVANLSQCIVTKMDEAYALGSILSMLLETDLPVSYLTHGQRVPEDIKWASAYQLVDHFEEKALHLTTENGYSKATSVNVTGGGVYVDIE